MEDPIVSDVIIENRAGVGSVFHDDSMFGTGKKDDPLGVNREQFLPQNDLLNFRNVGWGLSTLNIVAQPWGGVGMGGMTMLTMSGTFAGQFLSTSDNIDPNTGARYNTFDVCAMNSRGQASGFVCRLDEDESQGTVELFSPKELPVDDDNNFVASTHWVQKVLLNYDGFVKKPVSGQNWDVMTWVDGDVQLASPISRYFKLESWGNSECWFLLFQTEPTTTRFTIYGAQNESSEHYAAEIYMFNRDLSVVWEQDAPKTFDVEIFYDDRGHPIVHVSPKNGVVMERFIMTGVRSGYPPNGNFQSVYKSYEPTGDIVMAKVLTASKADIDDVKAQIGNISNILDYINGEAI